MKTKRKQHPSQARLRELFDYDPEGFLVWRYRPEMSKSWNARYVGTMAGGYGIRKSGEYWSRIKINEKHYSLLNIIWIFHYGKIPEGMQVKTNDVLSKPKKENLRIGRVAQTHAGIRVSRGSSNFVGVSVCDGGFKAESEKNTIGRYKTAEAAASAYDDWAIKKYGSGYIPNNSGCIDYSNKKLVPSSIKKGWSSSGKKGAYRDGKKWRSMIRINGKPISLGTFDTKEQAARAYNVAAYEHYGENAILNDIPDPLGKLEASKEEDVF